MPGTNQRNDADLANEGMNQPSPPTCSWRTRRKGVAGGVVPNPLPLSKLAVVDYATELLEETESQWDPEGPSPTVVVNRQRSQHICQLAQPAATALLWLTLQPYANARLCLIEVDRPESRNPIPIRRHVIDCFLEQSGIVGSYNDTALTDPGDVLPCGDPAG